MITTKVNSPKNMTKDQLIEMIYDIQKQFRNKETSYIKDKAILEQKITLLKTKVKEGEERESNMKRMYDSMLTALNPSINNTTNIEKEIAFINEIHKKELKEIKDQYNEIIKSLKNQINDFRLKKERQDNEGKKEQEIIHKRISKAEDKERIIEAKFKEMDSENRIRIKFIEIEAEKKLMKLKEILIKTNSEHKEELNQLKEQYEKVIKEIKADYEMEKIVTEQKLLEANNINKELQIINKTQIKNENNDFYSIDNKIISKPLSKADNVLNVPMFKSYIIDSTNQDINNFTNESKLLKRKMSGIICLNNSE